jgi:tetratricopeptide (TPR) repeat protein
LRAALAYALERDEVVVASDLISGLWFYWLTSGSGVEAKAWAERYVASPRQRVPALERFHGDLGAAEILRFAGDPTKAAELKRELVATGRANANVVVHGVQIERSIAATLSDLAYMELSVGNLREARSHAEEALALRRTLGLPHGIAHALLAVASVEYNTRDFSRAREFFAEAASLYEAAGSHGDALEARLEMAECELLLEHLDEAEALLRGTLVGVQEVEDLSFEIMGTRVAAMLASARGMAERAAFLFGAEAGKLRLSGLTLFGPLEEEIERTYAARARSALGDAGFERAYKRGLDESETVGRDLVFASID